MRRMILAAALVAAIANVCPSFAQTAAGDWHATITRPPVGEIRLSLHVDEAPGTLTGTLTAPDLGSPPISLADLKRDGATLSFSVPASRASFSGTWNAGSWTGTYKHPAGDSAAVFAPGTLPPLPPLPAVAGLDGRWEGKLQGVMPLVIRIETDTAGTRVMMDIPAQQATNIPIRSLSRDGAKVAFAIPAMMFAFEGQLAGETLEGTLKQGPGGVPLVLTRTSTVATPAKTSARPQTPKPPFPYASHDVMFDNPSAPGIRLGCTLTTPPGAPAPVAVLLSGSGAQNRNAEVLGHQTFAVLADHLASNGIAALRCDHRAYGKTQEQGLGVTLDDLVTDARAAIAFLRTRTDIDPARIGLIGHSLGGVVGPIAASQEKNIAFVVMLAGLGVPAADAIAEQRALLAESTGASPQEAAAIRQLWPSINRQIAAASDADARTIARDALQKTPKARPSVYPTVDLALDAMASPYARSTLRYDPAPVFAKIDAPVLSLIGSLDIQVSATQNLSGLRGITAGKDASILELPGINHAFQTGITGAMDEYATIEETFAPSALTTISDWIKQKTRR